MIFLSYSCGYLQMYVVVGVYVHVNNQGQRSRKQELMWHSPPSNFGEFQKIVYDTIIIIVFLPQYTRSPTCWCTVRVDWKSMTSLLQSGHKPYPSERYDTRHYIMVKVVRCLYALRWYGRGRHTYTHTHTHTLTHTHRCMHCLVKVLWACVMLTILPLLSTSRNKWSKVG